MSSPALNKILVTGSTGTVGAKLVRALASRPDAQVRAAVRAPAGQVASESSRELDFTRAETFAPALRGVDKVFLLAPSIADPVGASARFIEAARDAGVTHIVKLSGLGCDDEPSIAFGRMHLAIERLLAASGIAWTSLRSNNFMDNFLGERHGPAFAPRPDGTIALPWGSAACSYIAASDIAAVAAHVLCDRGDHAGRAYDLTGPEALRLDEVAAHLTAVSGRTFRYVDTPEEEVRSGLIAAHLPPPVVAAVLELHAIGKAGRTARVSSAVPDLLGRPATSFAAFANEHSTSWRTR
jgi:uncharacterized protein YbjT (DUF2867 family)